MKPIGKVFIILCVMIMSHGVSAQKVKVGDSFFDGEFLYSCQEIRPGGYIYFTGVNSDGEFLQLTLKHIRANEYSLEPSAQVDVAPFGAQFGWKVQYIRKEGMYFLQVLNLNNKIEWVLLLTPDGLDYCMSQYPSYYCQDIKPVCDCLLNRPYLRRLNKSTLLLMRNKIYARHGYCFESTYLQEVFSKMKGYVPRSKNINKIRLNIIESTNLALIMAEEAIPDELRSPNETDLSPYMIDDL